MTNCISGYQGADWIITMKVTKAMSPMPSPPPTCEDSLRKNSSGSTWEPVMSMCLRARMVMMQMQMRKKNHPKLMMDQRRTRRVHDAGQRRFDPGTSDIRGYECEDVDNEDADADEKASYADDWSMRNVDDWGHCTRECEDWTKYFRPVKYKNG